MTFKFQSANCIAVGTFNIYIIQPRWLAEVGIVPHDPELRFKVDMNRPGFHLSSARLKSEWRVRPTELVVSTKEPDEDCGESVARVLDILEWTPLMAVGINVEFVADDSILPKLAKICPLGNEELPEGYSTQQRSWHRSMRAEDRLFNWQISVVENQVELALNVHTELTTRKSHREATTIGKTACRRFFSDRQMITALAESVLGVDLPYDNNDL